MDFMQKDFLENLAITQKYISKHKLNEDRTIDLRTINFKIENQDIFTFEKYETDSDGIFLTTKWKNNPINDKSSIQYLFDKQIQLKKEKLTGIPKVEKSGRILISNYYDYLWEGFCEIVTKGFADEHDLLPIDTWFYLENGLLYSWIPDEYIEIASDCIWASSTDIFYWHDKDISEILKIKDELLIEQIKVGKKESIIKEMRTEKKKSIKKVSLFKKWFNKN